MPKLGLVIEDNEDLASLFSKALRAAGFEIEVLRDGIAAARRLDDITAPVPDIVILDLHLPALSGADVLMRLRANVRMGRTRVILATADAGMARYLENQADLVLLKPVSLAQLQRLALRIVADVF